MKKILVLLVFMFTAGLISCGDSSDSSPASTPNPTVFTVVDLTKSYTNVCFKGSAFDNWALKPMFDDGTNGDVTANDNTWTISLVVTESGSWGIVDNDGSADGLWLLASGDANREYTLGTDGTVSGQTTYTIPLPTTKMNVTFTVNVGTNNTLADIKGVWWKGSTTAWATSVMYDDGTNGDVTAGDGIFTVVINAATGEWGAELTYTDKTWADASGWCVDGSNPSYTVSDAKVLTGTTSIVAKAVAKP